MVSLSSLLPKQDGSAIHQTLNSAAGLHQAPICRLSTSDRCPCIRTAMDVRNALRGTHIEPTPACTYFVHTNPLARARIAGSSGPRFRISRHESNRGSGTTSEIPKMARMDHLEPDRERKPIARTLGRPQSIQARMLHPSRVIDGSNDYVPPSS
jgi:hypothetical protein